MFLSHGCPLWPMFQKVIVVINSPFTLLKTVSKNKIIIVPFFHCYDVAEKRKSEIRSGVEAIRWVEFR